jgi:hypothetical protein
MLPSEKLDTIPRALPQTGSLGFWWVRACAPFPFAAVVLNRPTLHTRGLDDDTSRTRDITLPADLRKQRTNPIVTETGAATETWQVTPTFLNIPTPYNRVGSDVL